MSIKAYLLYSVIWIILLSSCSRKTSEGRPSPLALDSTQLAFSSVSIAYSSPGVKERKIWGDLVPYGNIWRTGANEATVFSTSKPIHIQNELLPAGKYSVFTIPDSQKWTIIFNEEWDQWGAYNYDESKNALTIQIEPDIVKEYQERLKFYFEDNQLVFHWEYLRFALNLTE